MTRPNEPRPDAASMLRVNQAGEYGATRIYAGQLAVLRKDSPAAHAIAGMARGEERHERNSIEAKALHDGDAIGEVFQQG